MTTTTLPRPEVHGALALAERHLKTARRWRWSFIGHRSMRLALKHESKAQKLLARAARLGDRRPA
jgi:hypothetical protein